MKVRARAQLQDILVILLVVVVVLLLVLAARHTPSAGTTGTATPTPTAATGTTGNPSPHLVKATSLRAAVSAPAPVLSEYRSQFALLAAPGCRRAPLAAISTDGLRTLQAVTAPAAYILSLQVTGPTTAYAVGAGQTCQPALFVTHDRARTWAVASTSPAAWLALPGGVRNPRGSLTQPCAKPHREPLALVSTTSNTAVVMCHTGVFRTDSGGATWTSAGRMPRGRPATLAMTPKGQGILLMLDQGSCLGARVVLTKDAGRHWTSGQCLLRTQLPVMATLDVKGRGAVYSAAGTYATTDFGKHWR